MIGWEDNFVHELLHLPHLHQGGHARRPARGDHGGRLPLRRDLRRDRALARDRRTAGALVPEPVGGGTSSVSDLTGKRAVVTGASQGIGQATAIALARAGANVAGFYREGASDAEEADAERTVEAVRAAGREVILQHGDTGDPAAHEQIARAAVDAWGGIDVWVNNAARRDGEAISRDDGRGLARADGRELARLLLRLPGGGRGQMVGQGDGRIVNVTSVAHIQPLANLVAYCSAKGGVKALTSVLAVELGRLGISVNAVAPGCDRDPAQRPDVHAGGAGQLRGTHPARPDRVARGDRRRDRLHRVRCRPLRERRRARRRRRHHPRRHSRPCADVERRRSGAGRVSTLTHHPGEGSRALRADSTRFVPGPCRDRHGYVR